MIRMDLSRRQFLSDRPAEATLRLFAEVIRINGSLCVRFDDENVEVWAEKVGRFGNGQPWVKGWVSERFEVIAGWTETENCLIGLLVAPERIVLSAQNLIWLPSRGRGAARALAASISAGFLRRQCIGLSLDVREGTKAPTKLERGYWSIYMDETVRHWNDMSDLSSRRAEVHLGNFFLRRERYTSRRMAADYDSVVSAAHDMRTDRVRRAALRHVLEARNTVLQTF